MNYKKENKVLNIFNNFLYSEIDKKIVSEEIENNNNIAKKKILKDEEIKKNTELREKKILNIFENFLQEVEDTDNKVKEVEDNDNKVKEVKNINENKEVKENLPTLHVEKQTLNLLEYSVEKLDKISNNSISKEEKNNLVENQNFATYNDLQSLQNNYKLFVNRVQQQLSSLGGGGEVNLKYLDDVIGISTNPNAYDGSYLKFDNSLGKFVPVNISRTITNHTVTSGIATYSVTNGYNDSNNLDVYFNGVRQSSSDYIAIDNANIVITPIPTDSANLDIVYWNL